jgi:hypothetical protein
MAKLVDGLTKEKIERTASSDKAFKLTDGSGLYLYVTPFGTKSWRMNYRFQGKARTLSLGTYPDIDIESARLLRNDAKAMIKSGLDPSVELRKAKLLQGAENQLSSTSVRISNDGFMEIWKGRVAVRLTHEEATFVRDQLCKLV